MRQKSAEQNLNQILIEDRKGRGLRRCRTDPHAESAQETGFSIVLESNSIAMIRKGDPWGPRVPLSIVRAGDCRRLHRVSDWEHVGEDWDGCISA